MNKKIIFILIILIISLLGLILYINNQNSVTLFKLYGKQELTMYEDETYVEPGFICLDKYNKLSNNLVNIDTSNFNNNIGQHKIIYTVKIGIKKHKLERIINILENPFKDITFILLDSKIQNIDLNTEYKEYGFSCINNLTNEDLSNKVTIENNIKKEIGSYEVKYNLNYNNNVKTLIRTVNVLEEVNTINYNKEYTNQNILIDFISNIGNFKYMIDPNNNNIESNKTQIEVQTNGIYTFSIYDTESNKKDYGVNITNIDKDKPNIESCKIILKENNSTLEYETKDLDIVKFIIDNKDVIKEKIEGNEVNTLELNYKVVNNKIKFVDRANNITEMECDLGYPPIDKKGTEKIDVEIYKDTLRIWMESINYASRNYNATHVWVKDARKQLKSGIPEKFGEELKKTGEILEKERKQRGLENKAVVAVNGSGFVLADTYDTHYYYAQKAWNKTSVSPIVIYDGKVLRNLTKGNIPDAKHGSYGLKKDGWFGYYYYKKGTGLEENIKSAQQMIDDGVEYSWGFYPVFVINGEYTGQKGGTSLRNSICQIDKNNFVLLSEKNGSTSKAENIAKIMISYGCKVGFNLDGGGSTTLIYSDGQTTKTVRGGGRALADILYFHEQ